MKIFDIHSDILYDLYKKSDPNRFDFHLNQLQNSSIKGGLWTLYSPDEFDLIEALKIAINKVDLTKLPNFSVIYGVEGLRNLKTVDDLDILYNLGIRHCMVTWNEENKYATGAKADPKKGLTKEGILLYQKMEQLGMIIDLAHLNELSFYKALDVVSKNIIYSHGLCASLCDHPRNITKEQMLKLKKVDGLFGLTLANTFVHPDKNKQDLEHFFDHLDLAVRIMGVDNICFGFDFMDYLNEFPNSNIKEVPSCQYSHLILEKMVSRGYKEEEIKKIAYDNFYNRYKHLIIGGKNG